MPPEFLHFSEVVESVYGLIITGLGTVFALAVVSHLIFFLCAKNVEPQTTSNIKNKPVKLPKYLRNLPDNFPHKIYIEDTCREMLSLGLNSEVKTLISSIKKYNFTKHMIERSFNIDEITNNRFMNSIEKGLEIIMDNFNQIINLKLAANNLAVSAEEIKLLTKNPDTKALTSDSNLMRSKNRYDLFLQKNQAIELNLNNSENIMLSFDKISSILASTKIKKGIPKLNNSEILNELEHLVTIAPRYTVQ